MEVDRSAGRMDAAMDGVLSRRRLMLGAGGTLGGLAALGGLAGVPGTAAAARVEIPAGTPINVAASGAVGDGKLDETEIIQAALDLARQNGGGRVYIPAGTHRVTEDLVIGSNTLLFGDGQGASIIKRDPTADVVAVIRNFDHVAEGDDENIVIESLTIWRDGESAVPNDTFDNTIRFRGATGVAIRHCRIRGSAKAVHYHGCREWAFESNHLDTFVDNGFAANQLGAAQVGQGAVLGNVFRTPSPTGVQLGSSGVIVTQGGVTIAHNLFEDQVTNAIEGGDGISRVNVIGNVMTASGPDAGNSIRFQVVSGIQVLGNVLEQGNIYFNVNDPGNDLNERVVAVGNHLTGKGINFTNVRTGLISGNACLSCDLQVKSSQDVLVDGNVVEGAAKVGIWLVGNSGSPVTNDRIRLTNNVVFNCNQSSAPPAEGAGILVDGGDRVSIINNRAYDGQDTQTQQYGLYINGSTNVLDLHNDFTGNGTAERASSTGTVTYADMQSFTASGDAPISGYISAVINGVRRKLATID